MASKIWDDDMYHYWLEEHFSKVSTKDLSFDQANRAKKMLWKIVNGESTRDFYRISKSQAVRIATLEYILNWQDDKSRLAGFCKKQTGKDMDILKYDKNEANKIIVGLQRIIAPKACDYQKLNKAGNSKLYDCYLDIKTSTC